MAILRELDRVKEMSTATASNPLNTGSIAEIDPELPQQQAAERERQESHIELIASGTSPILQCSRHKVAS